MMFRPWVGLRLIFLGTLLASGISSVASAQQTLPAEGRQFPLNQYTPPGTAARWSLQAGRVCPGTFQQVRIHLPTTGKVTGYDRSPNQVVSIVAPAQMGLLVGAMYRLKIDGLPEFPNQEFYPSIELFDHLHPPPGQAERFPVEIELLADELSWAANGRLVTKVVYLEQPDRVPLTTLNAGPRITDLLPAQNALAEADLLGRPIAIVRLGGRVPDAHAPDPQFWGPLAPIQITAPSGPQSRTVQWTEPDVWPDRSNTPRMPYKAPAGRGESPAVVGTVAR